MIYKLDITDPANTPFHWLPEVAALKAPRTFDFQPGLNLLWGGNGSGKTTVISLLATLFHCKQGNQPVVTQDSIQDLWDAKTSGVAVEHDGQGVRHYDPGHTVGVCGSRLDDDFMHQGLLHAIGGSRASAGQSTVMRLNPIIQQIALGEVPDIQWKIHKESVNDTWVQQIVKIEEFLTANRKKGQPTVLFDEPDRNLSLAWQATTWEFIRAYSDEVQFIVATHSPFALRIPGANYIEMVAGSLDMAKEALSLLKEWPNITPRKMTTEKVEAIRAKRRQDLSRPV